jgi:hypothetical protein
MSRKDVKIVVDEAHVLSDGSKVFVKHIGRMYFYSRLYPDSQWNFHDENESFIGDGSPHMKGAKNDAMKRLADVMEADVMEKEN